MQLRRLTRDAGLTSGRELKQGSRVGSHRSNSKHAGPPVYPDYTRSRSQRCRDAGGTVLCHEEAASVLKRPLTSTIPSTTSRARLARWSSRWVWRRLRLAASCTATRSFPATCAPASREMRATACSSGKVQKARKPERARNARQGEPEAREQQHTEVRRWHDNGRTS